MTRCNPYDDYINTGWILFLPIVMTVPLTAGMPRAFSTALCQRIHPSGLRCPALLDIQNNFWFLVYSEELSQEKLFAPLTTVCHEENR